MKRKIEQLLALSLNEWGLMITAMVLLPGVALSLHMNGYRRARTLMHRFIRVNSSEVEIKNAHVIAHMVAVAATHGPYHANCLEQSLMLWWMLARHRIHSEIRFGLLNVPEETFGAHAWVECNGEALSGSQEFQQQLSVFG